MNDSIEHKAFRAIGALNSVATLISQEKINDYGEYSGFCDELDELLELTHESLNEISRRSRRLNDRIQKYLKMENR